MDNFQMLDVCIREVLKRSSLIYLIGNL